jgi:hypothetical protein
VHNVRRLMIRAINKTDNEDWGWAKEDRKNARVVEYSLKVHAWLA